MHILVDLYIFKIGNQKRTTKHRKLGKHQIKKKRTCPKNDVITSTSIPFDKFRKCVPITMEVKFLKGGLTKLDVYLKEEANC